MINGIINVYKERGFTSHDVVAKLRGILKQKKIGHTGTLDPEAEGVLPVCLGNGTKLCDMLTDRSKEYVAEFLLGISTDTQDTTGTVLTRERVDITPKQLCETVQSFAGEYDQIPPMYSACKVDGKRLYELARQGKEVERKPRRVMIEELEILEMDFPECSAGESDEDSPSLPRIKIRVVCSKGTYIRTLCHDIGEKLGCGAAMDSLLRTRVGSFALADAMKLSQIEEWAHGEQTDPIWIPVDQMFSALPNAVATGSGIKAVQNGNYLFPGQFVLSQEKAACRHGEEIRVYDGNGRFYGIYGYDKEKKGFRPVKMFL